MCDCAVGGLKKHQSGVCESKEGCTCNGGWEAEEKGTAQGSEILTTVGIFPGVVSIKPSEPSLPPEIVRSIEENVDAHERIALQTISLSKQAELHPDYIMSLLEKVDAFAEGHFVYKSGLHGRRYINKEQFGRLGASELYDILIAVASKAYLDGNMDFKKGKKITVIGPAYGAIHYTMPVCKYFESVFSEGFKGAQVIFRPGRTQLDANGKHYFPEKLIDAYMDTDEFIIIEDITNMGSTIREVSDLCLATFGIPVTRALCIVNRGGQTAQSMGLKEFYPFFDVNMDQCDPRTPEGLEEINSMPAINTVLGKGAKWVEIFGQGPYPADTDFASSYEFSVPVTLGRYV